MHNLINGDSPAGLAPPPETFRMESDSDRSVALVSVMVFAIITVAALIFGLLGGPSALAVSGVIIAGLAVYYVGDYLLWVRRGIRTVAMDREGITVYRGRARRPERIARERVTAVNVFSSGPRVIVNVMLGGQITAAPGATFFTGPRLRITNDNFNDRQFDEFVERVKRLAI